MASVTGIRGRFFATLLDKLLAFWGRHQETLRPVLDAAVSAAVDTLVQQLPRIIAQINPPGPTEASKAYSDWLTPVALGVNPGPPPAKLPPRIAPPVPPAVP